MKKNPFSGPSLEGQLPSSLSQPPTKLNTLSQTSCSWGQSSSQVQFPKQTFWTLTLVFLPLQLMYY